MYCSLAGHIWKFHDAMIAVTFPIAIHTLCSQIHDWENGFSDCQEKVDDFTRTQAFIGA
jgi:hypothetical protein